MLALWPTGILVRQLADQQRSKTRSWRLWPPARRRRVRDRDRVAECV